MCTLVYTAVCARNCAHLQLHGVFTGVLIHIELANGVSQISGVSVGVSNENTFADFKFRVTRQFLYPDMA